MYVIIYLFIKIYRKDKGKGMLKIPPELIYMIFTYSSKQSKALILQLAQFLTFKLKIFIGKLDIQILALIMNGYYFNFFLENKRRHRSHKRYTRRLIYELIINNNPNIIIFRKKLSMYMIRSMHYVVNNKNIHKDISATLKFYYTSIILKFNLNETKINTSSNGKVIMELITLMVNTKKLINIDILFDFMVKEKAKDIIGEILTKYYYFKNCIHSSDGCYETYNALISKHDKELLRGIPTCVIRMCYNGNTRIYNKSDYSTIKFMVEKIMKKYLIKRYPSITLDQLAIIMNTDNFNQNKIIINF